MSQHQQSEGGQSQHGDGQHQPAGHASSHSAGGGQAGWASQLSADAPAAYRAFLQQMASDMARMMDDMHKQPPSGNPDMDFLVMMIPHHQGAVDMSRLLLRVGTDPMVRTMAVDIIAAQTAEIEGMKGRLQQLRSGAAGAEYPPIDGTRGGPAQP